MTHTITKITCDKCEHQFRGVLHDLVQVTETYAATCPACKEQVFFKGKSEFFDGKIPADAVKIKYVGILQGA